MTGTIRTIRADKGFGFIKDDGGKDYFFHQSAVYGEGLQDLREGDSVEFDVGQGPKGPRAENVRRTSTQTGPQRRSAFSLRDQAQYPIRSGDAAVLRFLEQRQAAHVRVRE